MLHLYPWFQSTASDELISWTEFQHIHLNRTENSTVVREDGQVSFVGYPRFLMYTYSII